MVKRMVLSWTLTGLCGLGTIIVYLSFVRNAIGARGLYSDELCELYLLRHMLPDKHPLSFMFHGLPRNYKYPRLFWPCLITLLNLCITISSFIFTVVFTANNLLFDKKVDVIVFCSHLGAVFCMAVLMIVPSIQNHYCFKKMMKMGVGEIFEIKKEIEKKWPGFYIQDKK